MENRKTKKVSTKKTPKVTTGQSGEVNKTESEQTVGTTLLGSITYDSRANYENFLNGLTLEHAVIVLISAANFSQKKGIFSLDEAELIAKAIKKLSTKPETNSSESEK
jgi:hypothetical protein